MASQQEILLNEAVISNPSGNDWTPGAGTLIQALNINLGFWKTTTHGVYNEIRFSDTQLTYANSGADIQYLWYNIVYGTSVARNRFTLRLNFIDSSNSLSCLNFLLNLEGPRNANKVQNIGSTAPVYGSAMTFAAGKAFNSTFIDNLLLRVECYDNDPLGQDDTNEIEIYQVQMYVMGKSTVAPHTNIFTTYTGNSGVELKKGLTTLKEGLTTIG